MFVNLIRKVFPAILLAIDTTAFYLIYFGVTFVRTGGSNVFFSSDQILFSMIACNALALYLVGAYEYQKIERSARFISEHLIASVIGATLSMLVILLFVSYADRVGTNRTSLLGTFLLFTPFSILYRCWIGKIRAKRKTNKCIIFIGASEHTYEFIKDIHDQNFTEKIYVIANDLDKQLIEKLSSLGVDTLKPDQFDSQNQFIKEMTINKIILSESMNQLTLDKNLRHQLMRRHLQKNDVTSLENFFLSEFEYVPTKLVDENWPFEHGFRITKNVVYAHGKRTIDLFLSALILILASPVLLIAMLAVKLTSEGPIFFRQQRIGASEVPFTLFKLRTMKIGSDTKGDYTHVNDPRITPIGNFLRKSRLDELPQLINVIKGEMSLIGPRAEWEKLVRNYEEAIPHYHLRHIVKPGITGWAQVNYPYGANLEDTINKLKYDLYYVRYFSLVMDLTIIIKTGYTMLFGRGR
ncbi:MAG: exopolysaccharide biosynthesis polyprenyl glycosylphosphotransferase [Akkermansiaceae bacterium]|jgi:exopolysaccharide biosynthesis polyprenyl glycosylphosphotransferase|nr:exopolysaccharide biosynthesis polyprenyl glycosylphosphotransferase [Akkermansiaceae bacterium]